MKAIQITIDEALLKRVDRDPEAKKHGRSALVRRALEEYLKRKRDHEIAESYRRGYGEHPVAEDEFGPFGPII